MIPIVVWREAAREDAAREIVRRCADDIGGRRHREPTTGARRKSQAADVVLPGPTARMVGRATPAMVHGTASFDAQCCICAAHGTAEACAITSGKAGLIARAIDAPT